MTVETFPRFDIEALRRRAGERFFARGETYHRDGRVEILALEPRRVVARVAGTENYRVNLLGGGETIGGECTCAAFADYSFCKHMVASALAANETGLGAEPASAGALARIRAHLNAKPAEALVAMIVELAERDPTLFRRLEIASAASGADDKILKARLSKAIDEATRVGGFVEYGEVGGWASGVDDALDALEDLVPARAQLIMTLAERALERLETAVNSIDDSNGEGGALLERARDIHAAAVRIARPDPIALARDLFEREMQDGYDTFSGAAWVYEEALGETGLAEYRRVAKEAWDKLPTLAGQSRQSAAGDYFHLQGILDRFAERDGDVETRIALRAKDLSSSWKYLQLAEFCLAQGRADEALQRAEEGLFIFEDDRRDTRLAAFTAGLLAKTGRSKEADSHLKRAFERAPNFDLYLRWRKTSGVAARERALAIVEARLAREDKAAFGSPGDLMLEILAHEKDFAAAWAAATRYRTSLAARLRLARDSEATHKREAVEVYARRVDELANSAGNSAYAEAAGLVARMARLRGGAEQAAYVAKLKERFARKRNFMKLLE